MNNWRYVERVNVKRIGTHFIGEARTHAHFAVGEMLSTPEAAMESAAKALAAILAPLAAKYAPRDEFEDLL